MIRSPSFQQPCIYPTNQPANQATKQATKQLISNIYIYTDHTTSLGKALANPFTMAYPIFNTANGTFFGTRGDGHEIPGGSPWVQEPWFVWQEWGFKQQKTWDLTNRNGENVGFTQQKW